MLQSLKGLEPLVIGLYTLKHFSIVIVLINAASTTRWGSCCCTSLCLGGRTALLPFYREDLKSRTKWLVQCLKGAEVDSELWSPKILASIVIPFPCSTGFCWISPNGQTLSWGGMQPLLLGPENAAGWLGEVCKGFPNDCCPCSAG